MVQNSVGEVSHAEWFCRNIRAIHQFIHSRIIREWSLCTAGVRWKGGGDLEF